ncbi:MAG: hypothetical protein L0G94_14070 [Brachybacterium sp.]|uniref:hypothetical protein n=1 Tax=Brachybacterium sp. TaxID=1891286 RepID=UPI002649E8FD|nr:hypothetical protein [Brachybacterium sp.]MDN5687779.1 hypothetical protein [Brachybacterium sp.]
MADPLKALYLAIHPDPLTGAARTDSTAALTVIATELRMIRQELQAMNGHTNPTRKDA